MGDCSIDTPLDPLELVIISENLGPFEWRKLGLYLGISEPKIANWERQYMMNSHQAANQMLNTWHMNQIPREARQHLVTALEKCKLKNLAHRIEIGEGLKDKVPGMVPIPPTHFGALPLPQQVSQPQRVAHQPRQEPVATVQRVQQPYRAPPANQEPMETSQSVRKHEVSEILLRDLSHKLGSEWRMLGTYLGFETAEVQQLLEQHHNNIKECIFQMLLKWRNTNGVQATKARLKKALVKSDRADLEDFIDNPDDD